MVWWVGGVWGGGLGLGGGAGWGGGTTHEDQVNKASLSEMEAPQG